MKRKRNLAGPGWHNRPLFTQAERSALVGGGKASEFDIYIHPQPTIARVAK